MSIRRGVALFLAAFLLWHSLPAFAQKAFIVWGSNPTAAVIRDSVLHSFRGASSMAIDRFQNFYVTELDDNGLLKLSATGDSLRAVIGTGLDHYQFSGPESVDAHLSNAIFVADRFNHRIEQYTKELVYVSTLYTFESPDPAKQFGFPRAVAADDAGNIYVADGENKRVLKFRSDFSFERSIGSSSESSRPEALLTNPVALGVDANQHLLILDRSGRSLVEFDILGNLIHRSEFDGEGSSISFSSDTIFVLIPDRQEVRLYKEPELSFVGTWDINRLDVDRSSLKDFHVRNGIPYLLTRDALYRCALQHLDLRSK